MERAGPALFPLRSISIGIWTTRRSRRWLLYLPNRQVFVLLVACSHAKAETAWGKVWHQATDKRNPFCPFADGDPEAHSVIAFEVEWADIQGMDYAFPLHQDGRLVLEAKKIIKRTFRTVANAQQFYSWRPAADLSGPQPAELPHTASGPAQHGSDLGHAALGFALPQGGSRPASAGSRVSRRATFGTLHTGSGHHHHRHGGPMSLQAAHHTTTTPPSRIMRVSRSHHPRIALLYHDPHHPQHHFHFRRPWHRRVSLDATPTPSQAHSTASSFQDLKAMECKLADTTATVTALLATSSTSSLEQDQLPTVTSDSEPAATAAQAGHSSAAGSGHSGRRGWYAWLPNWSRLRAAPVTQAPSCPSPDLPTPDGGSEHGTATQAVQAPPAAAPAGHLQHASLHPHGVVHRRYASETSWSATPGLMTPASRMSLELNSGPGRPAVLAHVTAGQEDASHLPDRPCSRSSSHTALDVSRHSPAAGCAMQRVGSSSLASNPQPAHQDRTHGRGLQRKAVSANNLTTLTSALEPAPSALTLVLSTGPEHLLPPARASCNNLAIASLLPHSCAPHLPRAPSRLGTSGSGTQLPPLSSQPSCSLQRKSATPVPPSAARPPLPPFTRHSVDLAPHPSHTDASTGISPHPSALPAHTTLPALRPAPARSHTLFTEDSLLDTPPVTAPCTPTSQQAAEVPPACRFTAPSAVYRGRTVVITFKDPAMQPMLSQVVKSDVKLLHLYESGLPAWAVFLPSYGLWYRPWMRRVTFLLFTAISIASMILGFYDLYKNVPIVRQAMAALSAQIFPPAQQLFEWLEKHAQIRLSILLTYIFSKSPLFVALIRFLRTCMANMSQLVGPVWYGLRSICTPVVTSVTYLAASLGYALRPLGGLLAALGTLLMACGGQLQLMARALGSGLAVLLGPPAQALWGALVAVAQLVRLLGQLGWVVVQGPVFLMWQLGLLLQTLGAQLGGQMRLLVGSLGLLWKAVASWGKAARAAAPVAAAAGRTVAAAARAAPAPTASSWKLFARAGQEVWTLADYVRVTLFRCVKAFQAVTNFFIQMALAVNRHRVSLMMEFRSWLLAHPGQPWVPRAVANRVLHTQPSAHFSLAPGELLPTDLLDESGHTSAQEDTTAPTTPRTHAAAQSARTSMDPAAAGGLRHRARVPHGSGSGVGVPRYSVDVPASGSGSGSGVAALHSQGVGRVLVEVEEEEQDEWRGMPVGGGARRRVWRNVAGDGGELLVTEPLQAHTMAPMQDVWHEMVTVGPAHALNLHRASQSKPASAPATHVQRAGAAEGLRQPDAWHHSAGSAYASPAGKAAAGRVMLMLAAERQRPAALHHPQQPRAAVQRIPARRRASWPQALSWSDIDPFALDLSDILAAAAGADPEERPEMTASEATALLSADMPGLSHWSQSVPIPGQSVRPQGSHSVGSAPGVGLYPGPPRHSDTAPLAAAWHAQGRADLPWLQGPGEQAHVAVGGVRRRGMGH